MALIKLVNSIKAIADAIRAKTGTTAPMTLDEMAESIEYLEGDGGGPLETFILVDEDGYEMAATLTEEEVELTATSNDIRKGTVAVTNAGVITGEKEIPGYITKQGKRVIKSGQPLIIPFYSDQCEYTKLQVIVCAYNTSVNNSVAAEMVVIDDAVYEVNSVVELATVTVDTDTQSVNLGVNNESDNSLVLIYMTIKEVY
jgi:hypothetical protein